MDTESEEISIPDNVLGPLLVASGSSTVKEALECLIEIAKTASGRLDLASKNVLIPALELCQSPLLLSEQERVLSVKMLRNLCAGEIKNQNLFIERNGVGILSMMISSMGLTSGSDNGLLRMVLQALGNVSLAGEEHRLVVWREFFPLRFLDIARVQNKETCDPLCMVLYTCYEGSKERSVELLADPGLGILREIIQTVSAVGFQEDWLKLLLSRICLEDNYFSTIFSKLSPVVANGNSDDTGSRKIHFGAEQAFLLSILSEILNERAGEIVVPIDFSLCILGILRNAVGLVDFEKKGNVPLPTGSSDTDVLGYTLSILRDIIACDATLFHDQDEKLDPVDKLVSAGLIKLLITLLRELEPPAIIKKAMNQSEANHETMLHAPKCCPYKGFRRDIVAIIGNCSYHRKHVQDEIREENGILLLLQQCVTDEDNPFLREWGIWSIRNILEGNTKNQELVTNLELQKSVDMPEIAAMGLRVEVDPQTRRAKLVNIS